MTETSPNWVSQLDPEEIAFLKKFLLASGSLKEVASIYHVSYPTVRLRLDRLIQKVRLIDDQKEDEYVTLIKKLAIDEKLDVDVAKLLISEYRQSKNEPAAKESPGIRFSY